MNTKQFIVNVIYNEGYWIARNELLPIATEAKSLNKLIERANLIAPEIALLNKHVSYGENLTLKFIIESELRVAA